MLHSICRSRVNVAKRSPKALVYISLRTVFTVFAHNSLIILSIYTTVDIIQQSTLRCKTYTMLTLYKRGVLSVCKCVLYKIITDTAFDEKILPIRNNYTVEKDDQLV